MCGVCVVCVCVCGVCVVCVWCVCVVCVCVWCVCVCVVSIHALVCMCICVCVDTGGSTDKILASKTSQVEMVYVLIRAHQLSVNE